MEKRWVSYWMVLERGVVEVGVVEEDVVVYIVVGRLLCLLWKEVVDVVEFELDEKRQELKKRQKVAQE